MWKNLRILILLLILAPLVLLFRSDREHSADWDRTQRVAVYPYSVADDEAVSRFIASLEQSDMDAISDYFSAQARRYHLPQGRPFELILAEPIHQAPPTPPAVGQTLARLRWAVGLRWWRWRFDRQGLEPDIIAIARFNTVTEIPPSLHSIGIAELRLAVANLPAVDTHRGYNQVLLAHEILHTVGASDLYHPATGLPVFPAGYAEPELDPRYPQELAELMAGRIPVQPGRATQAMDLAQTRIGPRTAREIGWLRD